MLVLRAAQMPDARMLFTWRNDSETVAASLSERPVEWAEHKAWLADILKSEDAKLFIALADGRPVGMARFDRRDDVWEMSWTVAPEARGCGHGQALVSAARARHGGKVIARIKERNVASRRIARGAGFSFVESVDGIELWRAE